MYYIHIQQYRVTKTNWVRFTVTVKGLVFICNRICSFRMPKLAISHSLPIFLRSTFPHFSPARSSSMYRAAAQALRTTHQSTVRGLSHGGSAGRSIWIRPNSRPTGFQSTFPCRAATQQRNLSQSGPKPQSQSSQPSSYSAEGRHSELPLPPLKSSMYFRHVSVALVSGLVGYGAWYSYNGTSADHAQALSRGFTTTTNTIEPSAEPTRHVLVIGADQLHKGTVVGDEPISKMTNHDGRRVVEIINPEQATEVLRKSEESYLVNRGQGVVRYDLVQLPSNNPIEDDHDEKIVQVPSRGEGASDADSSDWMFWGVFDGHA